MAGHKPIHGQAGKLTRTVEYTSWASMLARCYDLKNKRWANYGGRGIAVCERWFKFENFFADMGKRPSKVHSIDRRDNGGNYEPSNCRWATAKDQARNRRSSMEIILHGVKRNFAEACEERGLPYHRVYQRIARLGWSPERAML